MSDLKLDLRSPVIVIVGDFNPAIFRIRWVATHLFDIPQGSEIQLMEAVVQVNDRAMMRLSFIDGVAINAQAKRLELFAIDSEPASLARIEQITCRLLETLPHTPVNGIGINLQWTDSEPDDSVVDMFNTPEGLEGSFPVNARQLSCQIGLGDVTLNYTRLLTDEEVKFNFNYHRTVTGAVDCASQINGSIIQKIDHSRQLIYDNYGYSEHSRICYGDLELSGEGDDEVS